MSAPSLSRRRFLQLAAAGAGAAALGFGVWSRRRDDPGPWVEVFGERTGEVRDVGRRAVDAGLVADVDAALDAVSRDGFEARDGGSGARLVDPAAVVRAARAGIDAELAADELVVLDGFLFTPYELALAALAHWEV